MTTKAVLLALTIGAAFVPLLAQAQRDRAAPPKLAAGQTFRECRNCPEMMVLPAGQFTMGSPANEPERRESEPQREITFARPFALSRTAVTWNQWEACVRDRWCDGVAVEMALKTREEDGQPNPDYKDWGRGTRPQKGGSKMPIPSYVSHT